MVARLTDNQLETPDQLPLKFPGKCGRKKSVVWDHFRIENADGDKLRAHCNWCNKSFSYFNGSKPSGTSHMKRHISRGSCRGGLENNVASPITQNGTPAAPGTTRKRKSVTSRAPVVPFSQEVCNYEIAKMIILQDYPLHMVEHYGFIEFVKSLQPQFKAVSFETIRDEIGSVHATEKQKLLNHLSGIPGRVNLAIDLWISDEHVGHAVLSGHFIDSNWELNRRVLNVVAVPYVDSDIAFNYAVCTCLSEWALEGKLFTITLDRSFASDDAIENLRRMLSIKNSRILNGQLLIGSCYARCLSHLATGVLEVMGETVQKVRDCVKYVKASESLEGKFMEIKRQLQVPSTKTLVVDNQARWDTTFHMLSAASELKEVFECLDTSDPGYREAPSLEEWKQIKTLCDCLKRFYDSANVLFAQSCLTTDKFFEEVCNLLLMVGESSMGPDPFLCCLLTRPLVDKLNCYWGDSWLVLAVAVAMDPRYKLKLVKFKLSRIYGEHADSFLTIIEEKIHELYEQYKAQSLPSPSIHVGGEDNKGCIIKTEPFQEDMLFSPGDPLADFDVYISDISSHDGTKSELEQYLEESLEPRDRLGFEVIDWWKMNGQRYPVLSEMAADMLSIPLSTVSSDSVFETTRKKVDSYRSSLRPSTLQALICAKDWLQYSAEPSLSSSIVPLNL